MAEKIKEILVILISAIILGAIWTYPGKSGSMLMFMVFFLIIIGANVLVKKYIAYLFETDLRTKFWSIYQYHFKKGAHFRAPVYMIWLPIFLSLISKGFIKWIPLLEFDISPRIERVARRHEGMYRFTEIVEWHVALIVMWGILTNLALAIIGYLLGGSLPGGETFARLNIYYALWSLLPISGLDGTKMFFGSRVLWFSFSVIVLLFFVFSFFLVR